LKGVLQEWRIVKKPPVESTVVPAKKAKAGAAAEKTAAGSNGEQVVEKTPR
jgi:hypothetical protein